MPECAVVVVPEVPEREDLTPFGKVDRHPVRILLAYLSTEFLVFRCSETGAALVGRASTRHLWRNYVP